MPITTPAASPQSNGMSEAFMSTLRRDYLAGADLSTAAVVLAQIPAWIADYNAVAPHSARLPVTPTVSADHVHGGCYRVAQTASRTGVQSRTTCWGRPVCQTVLGC